MAKKKNKHLKHMGFGALLGAGPHCYHALVHAIEAKEFTSFLLERSVAFTALTVTVMVTLWAVDKEV